MAHSEELASQGRDILGNRPGVTPQSCATPSSVATWVRRGLAYALTLPAK